MALKTLAWLLVPLVGLAELGGHFFVSTRPPDLTDWKKAKDTLAKLRGHGELVVITPAWAEPNARHAFGDGLMPLRDVARPDESGYGRAIEVSILGSQAPQLSGWRRVAEKQDGKFRFRVFENPSPAKVTFDFLEHLPSAEVFDLGAGGETPCPWNPSSRREAGGLHGDPAYPAMRHQCAGPGWHFVGVTVIEDERWRGRRCIWAHPTQNATLGIRFRGVPLGKVVRGHGGLPFWVERELKGAPVEVDVLIGGELRGSFLHRDGDGWKAFEVTTGPHAGTTRDVEFRVRARRTQHRQFCFQADTR